MRILRINIDYKAKPDPAAAKQLTHQELTENYLNFGINAKYPDGIDGQLKRTVGRLQRKIEEAVENNKDTVELEESEFDLITNAVETAKYPTHLCRFVILLEDAIREAKIVKSAREEELERGYKKADKKVDNADKKEE